MKTLIDSKEFNNFYIAEENGVKAMVREIDGKLYATVISEEFYLRFLDMIDGVKQLVITGK